MRHSDKSKLLFLPVSDFVQLTKKNKLQFDLNGLNMQHLGKVLAIEGKQARVQIAKSSECATCKACEMFDTQGQIELLARNDIQAKIGDLVKIEIAPAQVIGNSLLIFVFPIIFLIIGYWGGLYLGGSPLFSAVKSSGEGAGIIGALSALIISFILIFVYDKFYSKRNRTTAWLVPIENFSPSSSDCDKAI